MLRSMKALEHYGVRAADGDVGHVADFLFEDTGWEVRYLVVDTGGLFSRQRALVPRSAFASVDYAANRFDLTLSRSSVERSATLDAKLPASMRSERDGRAPGDPPADHASAVHLRSARGITGYHVEATDGPLGHVRDLIVDDETWRVRYMVITTTEGWAGKAVVISPPWAERVRWVDRTVEIGMMRGALLASPEWSATTPVDGEYAETLARHYEGIPGWRGRDRSFATESTGSPAPTEPQTPYGGVARTDDCVAAHEERQIRASDEAVVRASHARATRMR